jgi:predicted AAA+ superfamily ATPase
VYSRSLQPIIEELLAEFRVLYLTGARQSGKTTLERKIAERLNMGYITLDEQATLASVESDPQGVIRTLGTVQSGLSWMNSNIPRI